MIHSVLRAACVAGMFVVVAAAPAAANCGAEGCPLNPQGLETSARRWSFDLGYQYVD